MALPLLKYRLHPSPPRMTTLAYLRFLRLYMPMVLLLYHTANRGYQYTDWAIILQKQTGECPSGMQQYQLDTQSNQVHSSHVFDTSNRMHLSS